MMKDHLEKKIMQQGSVTYFTKGFERTLFFILTLVMMIWGIAEKLGTYLGY